MQKVGSCLVSSLKSEKANVAGEEGAKGAAGGKRADHIGTHGPG